MKLFRSDTFEGSVMKKSDVSARCVLYGHEANRVCRVSKL